MTTRHRGLASTVLALGVAVSLLAVPGCETNTDVSREDSPGWPAFYISPASVTLRTGDVAVFTAVGGRAPFGWTVSNAALGTLAGTNATVVTYTSPATAVEGINVIEVRDSQGWVAHANAVHSGYSATAVQISPSTTELGTDGETVEFTASAGNPPYNWSVDNGALGSVVPVASSDNTKGLYTRLGAGTVNVTVADAIGQRATAVVMQP